MIEVIVAGVVFFALIVSVLSAIAIRRLMSNHIRGGETMRVGQAKQRVEDEARRRNRKR